MKYKILIESTYRNLPFDGFTPVHKGNETTVWESIKRYHINDANNYIERLTTKHPESIYAIKAEEV